MRKIRFVWHPLLVVVVTALAVIAWPRPVAAAETIHIVRQGETLVEIAAAYDVPFGALLTVNGLYNPNVLYPGQELIIPTVVQPVDVEASLAAARPTTYIIQPGETLGTVAQRYDINIAELARLNDIYDYNLVFVGQSLRLPPVEERAAADAAAPTAGSRAEGIHYVQEGETLTSIATEYGLTYTMIQEYNEMARDERVVPGQAIAIPQLETILDPTAIPPTAGNKRVVVDKSEQHAYLYENDQLVYDFIISTGMASSATAVGNFQILNKIPNAYAGSWDLQMPYWLGIYWSGPLQNGFHALPIMSDGTVLWEGFLGQPASFGCIILDTGDAAILYDWVDIGTEVIVQW